MNEATASIVRTFIKTAGVVVIFIGWPKLRKPNVFNQTVIQPSEANDLNIRSVILELTETRYISTTEHMVFSRVVLEGVQEVTTDTYSMRRKEWVAAGKPDSISITVSNLTGASV